MMLLSVALVVLVLVPLCAMGGPVKPGVIGLHRAPDFVDVYYDSDRRDRLICESATYQAVADLVHPAIAELRRPDGPNLLRGTGLTMELEAADGTRYSSRSAPKPARRICWTSSWPPRTGAWRPFRASLC